MAALPLLLAGPIVRRVTARSVSVWVALSEEADVTLSLWDQAIVAGAEDGVFVPTDPALHSASRHTIRIGSKLHFAVVTVDISPPAVALLPGKLSSYNVAC